MRVGTYSGVETRYPRVSSKKKYDLFQISMAVINYHWLYNFIAQRYVIYDITLIINNAFRTWCVSIIKQSRNYCATLAGMVSPINGNIFLGGRFTGGCLWNSKLVRYLERQFFVFFRDVAAAFLVRLCGLSDGFFISRVFSPHQSRSVKYWFPQYPTKYREKGSRCRWTL